MPSHDADLHKPRRRWRIPLSCDPCRYRKIKCNREKPCQNCLARDEQATCRFRGTGNVHALDSPPGARERAAAGAKLPDDEDHAAGAVPRPAATVAVRDEGGLDGDAMRRRIAHLEATVKRLVAERPQASLPPPSACGVEVFTPEKSPTGETGGGLASDDTTPDHPPAAAGRTIIDGVHSVYLGRDDWLVVLQEIQELQRTWEQESHDQIGKPLHPTLSHTVDGSSLLFNHVKPLEKFEILSTLPPKHEADQLVARFFDHQTFPLSIPPILHEPTFMREYEEHWMDPSRTNLIWLGLVFSILSITMLAFHQYGEPPEYRGLSESLFQLYRMRTAQCLVSGDITKCLPYTVEALRFNATAELNRKDDNRRGLWIMTGVIVRAAINMGYHRDPAGDTSGISILQAEYRRRVWSSVVSIDDMASFLSGFPRTLSAVYSDTVEPRNVFDSELTVDLRELPPSRPLGEATSVTYLIVKGRLFRELGRVADFNSSPNLGSYEHVMALDRAVNETYKSFPAFMRAHSSPASGSAPRASTPSLVRSGGLANFSNLSLASMYHRGICTLHRPFLAKAWTDARFALSRRRCIASALELLAFQEVLDPAFYRISQTRQMLMLGSMVLFLELALRHKASARGIVGEREEEQVEQAAPKSADLLQALDRSSALLVQVAHCCDEVSKVHQLLDEMLATFRDGRSDRAGWNRSAHASELDASDPFWGLMGGPSLGPSEKADLLEKSWNDMDLDFDWATWDSLVDESGIETGPVY